MYTIDASRSYTLEFIVDKVNLPSMTVSRTLENLVMLHILRKNRISRLKTEWEFRPGIINMIDGAELYKKKSKRRKAWK